MKRSLINREEAFILLPDNLTDPTKASSKKFELTSKSSMKKEESDFISYKKASPPKLILPKNDRKIYESFKNMLKSYDKGRLIRGRTPNA